ncbi:MAG: hypothetical protein KBF73_09960 [Flavobacteriales bacterium]|jgi:uncharacterized protein|nr:hypothetical protein [Flavobacteriales bacterium]
MARIVIPKTAEKMLALSKLVYAKHTADGATSPLNALQDYNWGENGLKVAQAEALHAKAKELAKKLEKLYQDRDALLAPVEQTVRSSAKLLSSIYKSSPKNLGEWGFEVNDTPQAKKAKP